MNQLHRTLGWAVLVATFAASPQEAPPAALDQELRTAFDRWETKWKAYTEAMTAARQSGQLTKGGALPPAVDEAQRAADAEREAIVKRFGRHDDLAPASYRLLARLHETGRDYPSAVKAYEQSLAKGPPGTPDLETLGSLCIAAMNSKDDALAARWMRVLIAEEDRRKIPQRNLAVRTSYYPRTLIAVDDWEGLGQHLAVLAADGAPACTAAAATFGVVLAIHRGDLAGANARVAAIRAEPATYPDHQAWAVLAHLALQVHDGRFEEGAAAVREFLARPAPEGRAASAIDANQRRYLAAVEPFLGQPAPKLQVDHWVGGQIAGDDPLAALRGQVVVLDFWQPWCEPCRKAMPEMVATQKAHPGRVQVIGVCKVENYGYDVSERKAVRPIAPEDYPAHVADFRLDMGLNYPLAVADTGANTTAYRIAGVPTLVIIDGEGIVRYMSCGAGEPGLFRLAVAGVIGAGRRR